MKNVFILNLGKYYSPDIDLAEYSSPDTNPNYFNDYELDEFEDADETDEAEKDGTWDEDRPEFDLNINFELGDSAFQENVATLPPNPNRRIFIFVENQPLR